MKRLTHIALLLAAFILSSAHVARAQGELDEPDEYQPFPTAVAARTVVLRSGPSTRRARLRLLRPASVLEILSPNKREGFYFVLTRAGEQGWVWGNNVRVETMPPGATDPRLTAARRERGPCRTSFSDCPTDGCADPAAQPEQALLNRTKQRPPTTRDSASALALTFGDFKSLQTQAARILEKPRGELSQIERDKLRNLRVTRGRVAEGQLASVNGYIALSEERPGSNGGESVNCKFTGQEFSDFHIPVVASKSHDEFKSIVVEMIPQGRSPGWTLAKLRAVQRLRRHVLIAGALFFDNIHVVNQDRTTPISNQPRRVSVWELHPVSDFFVCNKTNRKCDTTNPAEWTPLEDFVEP